MATIRPVPVERDVMLPSRTQQLKQHETKKWIFKPEAPEALLGD